MVINYRQQLVVCFSCSPDLVEVTKISYNVWQYLIDHMNEEKKMLLADCKKPEDLFARPPLVLCIVPKG